MQTPIGTKIYIKWDSTWQELGCVTNVSGIGGSMEKRDRTSLVDKHERQIPTWQSRSNVSLQINLASIQALSDAMMLMRDAQEIEITILFSGTFANGLYDQDSEVVQFGAFIDSLELSDVAAYTNLNYTMALTLTSDFTIHGIVQTPWLGDNAWLGGNYWR